MKNLHKNISKPYKGLNVIVADTDWQTFDTLSGFGDDYNIVNLSSDFAVKFIMEYEKIDVIFVSKKIPNLENIKKLAARKKMSVYIFGENTKYPVVKDEVISILENEKTKKDKKACSVGKSGIKNIFKRIFEPKNRCVNSYVEKEDPSLAGTQISAQNNISGNGEELKKSGVPEIMDKKPGKSQDKDIYNHLSPHIEPHTNFEGADQRYNNKNHNGSLPLELKPERSPGNIVAIKQKIIVFVRAKGGVGTTILSLFLAARFSKLKTLLVDLNFSEGGSDVGYYLEIPKTPNMIMFTDGYSRNALDSSVINIKNSFDVLQSPPTYELSRKMDLQDIYSLVDIARKKYHLIIFDLPNRIDDIYLGILDLADIAVMVSDFSRGSIGRLTDINSRFIYGDLEKILILNRNNNGNGRYLIKNHLKDFFNAKDVVSLNEIFDLSGRSEFRDFDFECLEGFEPFMQKVMERLTCD